MLVKNSLDNLSHMNGLKKVWISHVYPEIDGGEYPIKRVIHDLVKVEADIFCDSIDEIYAVLLYKHHSDAQWSQVVFTPLVNDRMQAIFEVKKLGTYFYTIHAWANDFSTWHKRFIKKLALKDDWEIEALSGIEFLEKAKQDKRAPVFIDEVIHQLKTNKKPQQLLKLISKKEVVNWATQNYQPHYVTTYKELAVTVDRLKARFSAWYELFPRCLTADNCGHGNFQNLIDHLPHIHRMGFDVIYLPPIHPIGKKNRKGANNAVQACNTDPGSPWAIGSAEGGHTSIHPQLGTLEDFHRLIKAANQLSIDIALDFALQCSPDHPYLNNHPDWFKIRPDGTLQYAENPPKKYQDIYPINFASKDWQTMWLEFRSILLFWIKEGVKIFRVDNPHTKPFIFWEWVIQTIKVDYPEVIFLSEAFTRPKPMYHLAKCGFSQSYTYFTWRNHKDEIISYMQELTSPPVVDFFRPNFWPNTPDILPEYLQKGGRPAFIIRFILAATLSSNYGIYGPAYENCINTPMHEGSEEYLDSEKYAIACWKKSPDNIIDMITKVNQFRHRYVALQNMTSLTFYPTDNPQLICYSKHDKAHQELILIVVNLDYTYKQSGFIDINLTDSDIIKTNQFIVYDLLTDKAYPWQNGRCYVELNPNDNQCAHIFHVREDIKHE